MFNFRSDIEPEQQNAILEKINRWKDVSKATRLKADTKNKDLLRLAYAYIEDDADADDIIKLLSEIPEIESASLPARRKLL